MSGAISPLNLRFGYASLHAATVNGENQFYHLPAGSFALREWLLQPRPRGSLEQADQPDFTYGNI